MSNSTQLTTPSNFNVNNLIFSVPAVFTIPNSKLTYRRVNISTRNTDGSVGELVLEGGPFFSYGVSPNTSVDNPELINGYTLPLCLWNRDGPTASEKQFTDTFNTIVDHCRKYVLEHRDDIEKYELDESDLKKFNPLYWKKEKGKVVEGTGPTLYCKLVMSKKNGVEKILSKFYDSDSSDALDPMDLIGKYNLAKCAIKIESIYVGNKVSLQIKLWEANISLLDKGTKRLLQRSPVSEDVLASANARVEQGSIEASDSESGSDIEVETVSKPAPKVVVAPTNPTQAVRAKRGAPKK